MNTVALVLATAALVMSTLERRSRSRVPVTALVVEKFPWSSALIVPSLAAVAAGVIVVLGPAACLTAAGWVSWSRVASLSTGVVVLGGVTLVAKILLAATEELVFRAAVFDQVARRTSLGTGVFASAALFALAHFGRPEARSPLAGAVYMLDGVGFSFAYLATGSLWVPTCWHAAKNVTIWLLYSQSTLQFTGGLFEGRYLHTGPWIGGPATTGAIDVAATVAVVAVAVHLATRRARHSPPQR
jgi:membrane protease YdiL (CAAX protease family)